MTDTKNNRYFLLILITLLSSLFFWFCFYFNIPGRLSFPKTQLETVFANYDGPNYMVIAKCGYNKTCISHNFSLPLPLEYYPAHLPGFPLLIHILSFFTTGPKAMLLAALFGSIFLSLISYRFFSLYIPSEKAYWLAILLNFLPARLYILHQIGAPETWFLGYILASLYFFKKDKYFLSAIFAALAQVFKSPGILLFLAYGIFFLKKVILDKKKFGSEILKFLPFALVPLSVAVIFSVYYLYTGDFWAYFHSGDNFHLNPLPYLVFISNHTWINTIWLEDIIYIYFLSFLGVARLIKKYSWDITAVFSVVFLAASVLVAHRDISRYIAPLYPLLLLSYQKVLNKPVFKLIFILLLPAIFLYAVNFVIGNTAPIADWKPYL
ncbi:MAG TPA: hypothetical protein VF828_03910 [Patescibacteria group bacterium]